MDFNEIMQINQEPFEDNIIDLLIHPELKDDIYVQDILSSIILRYLDLFVKKHKLNLTLPEMRKLDIGLNDYVPSMWDEIHEDLFLDSLSYFGWNYFQFGFDDIVEDFNYSTEDGQATFLNFVNNLIEKNYIFTSSCKNMVCSQLDMVYESTMAEYGYVFFMWNDRLSEYLEYRLKHPEIIKKYCGKENQEIEHVLQSIYFPIIYAYEHKRGDCDGHYYSATLMGSDGYYAFDFSSYNPNWIIKAFVLRELLEFCFSKIELLENLKTKKSA